MQRFLSGPMWQASARLHMEREKFMDYGFMEAMMRSTNPSGKRSVVFRRTYCIIIMADSILQYFLQSCPTLRWNLPIILCVPLLQDWLL